MSADAKQSEPHTRKRKFKDDLESVLHSAHHGAKDSQGRLTDPTTLQRGDFVSCTMVYQVTDRKPGETTLATADGRNSVSIVGEGVMSQEFYTTKAVEEKKVCRSFLASILQGAKDAVVEVTFRKKPDAKAQDMLVKEISDGKHETRTKKQRVALATRISQGPKRVLVGRVISSDEITTGRTTMIDVTIQPPGHRVRQVDHRSIISLVYKNIRYINTSK